MATDTIIEDIHRIREAWSGKVFLLPNKKGTSKEPKPRTPGIVPLPTSLTRHLTAPAPLMA